MEQDKLKEIDKLLNSESAEKEQVKNNLTAQLKKYAEEQQRRESVFKGLDADERAELVGKHIKDILNNGQKELFNTDDDAFNEAYSWEYDEMFNDILGYVDYREYIHEEKGDDSDLLHFATDILPLIVDGVKVVIITIAGQGEYHTYVHTDKDNDLSFVKKYYDFEDFIKGEVL